MAEWRGSVVTEYGEQLLAEAVAGECAIEFEKVSIGCGIYSVEEMTKEFLRQQSGLKEEQTEYGISSLRQDENVVILRVLMSNESVENGFYITEMGLWARRQGSEEEPVLYSIMIANESDYFPDLSAPTTVNQAFRMFFSSADVKVSIVENMGAYVTADDFNEEIEKLDANKVNESDIADWARQPEKPSYSKIEVGLGNVDNTSDNDKPVSAATQAALDLFYANANQFTLNKIAELVNGAPATMDTLKEIADVIAANKSVVDALNAAIGSKASQAELDTHVNNNNIHFTASERQQLGSLVSQFGSKANAIAPLGCSTLPSNLLSYCSKFGLSYSSTLGYYNLYSEFSDNLNTQFVTAAGTGYRIEKSGYYNLRIQATITGSCSATSAVKRTGIRVGSNTGSWLLQALGRLQTWESLNDSSDVHLGAGTILVPIFQMDSNGSTVTTATVDVVMRILPLFIKN